MRFNFMISYTLAGAGTAMVVTLLIMGMLKFSPPALPKFEPVVQHQSGVRDGIVQRKDMFGLIQSKTDYVSGYPNGGSIHFYPNKSIARVLEYREGKLNGLAREYYEASRNSNQPIRGKMGAFKAISKVKMGQMGLPKAVWTYRDGIKEGPYELYYDTGGLKEQGTFTDGDKTDVHKFTREGDLKGEAS